jgi:hypothetical protein
MQRFQAPTGAASSLWLFSVCPTAPQAIYVARFEKNESSTTQMPKRSAERRPEKAGVGGSIPSLATTLTLVESAFSRLFFYLCQICAMDFPDQVVLQALILGRPLRIVKGRQFIEPVRRGHCWHW